MLYPTLQEEPRGLLEEGGRVDRSEKEENNCKRKAYWKGKENCAPFPKETVVGRGKKKKKSSPILEDREVEKINKCSSFQEEKEDGGNGKKKCSSIS